VTANFHQLSFSFDRGWTCTTSDSFTSIVLHKLSIQLSIYSQVFNISTSVVVLRQALVSSFGNILRLGLALLLKLLEPTPMEVAVRRNENSNYWMNDWFIGYTKRIWLVQWIYQTHLIGSLDIPNWRIWLVHWIHQTHLIGSLDIPNWRIWLINRIHQTHLIGSLDIPNWRIWLVNRIHQTHLIGSLDIPNASD
jgi:hypothetical protein